MKISAFTFVRNADRYYFPIIESIRSILPIVDEYIIAMGNNDVGDNTRELIESINSNKIKILDRIWSESDFIKGRIYANETNFALSQCTGDWCFYLQVDEVIHEKSLNSIVHACEKYLSIQKVDGLLFNYYHFYGDYDHHLPVHGWYKNEIRIVRNNIDVFSYKDAQSFRKKENKKLNIVKIDPYVYHYGWVRPPEIMESKKVEQNYIYAGIKNNASPSISNEFDYGALGNVPNFIGSHPKVMEQFIAKIHWKNKLNYSTQSHLDRPKMKHERMKYKLLTFFENYLNEGNELFGFSNWEELKINNF